MQLLNFVAFIYVAEVRPFEDEFLNKMELFNEIVNIMCVNLVFCFSDVITDAEQKLSAGFIFIGVVMFVIIVHLSIMATGQIRNLIQKCKKRSKNKQPRKKVTKNQKRVEEKLKRRYEYEQQQEEEGIDSPDKLGALRTPYASH